MQDLGGDIVVRVGGDAVGPVGGNLLAHEGVPAIAVGFGAEEGGDGCEVGGVVGTRGHEFVEELEGGYQHVWGMLEMKRVGDLPMRLRRGGATEVRSRSWGSGPWTDYSAAGDK